LLTPDEVNAEIAAQQADRTRLGTLHAELKGPARQWLARDAADQLQSECLYCAKLRRDEREWARETIAGAAAADTRTRELIREALAAGKPLSEPDTRAVRPGTALAAAALMLYCRDVLGAPHTDARKLARDAAAHAQERNMPGADTLNPEGSTMRALAKVFLDVIRDTAAG
jgi:hypothetical protein